MIIFTGIIFLGYYALTISVVTEKDLEEQLGVDVNAMKQVNWKEFVNSNPSVVTSTCACGPPGPTVCLDYLPKQPDGSIRPNGTLKGCCNQDEDCNHGPYMRCGSDLLCECKPGIFLNENETACVDRPKKKLGQSCSEDMDNCHTAFALCINGTCACRDGFVRVKHVCKPTEYYCPYKTPLFRNGMIWPCKANSTENYCPVNYTCIAPNGTHPIILTPSGIEQGYCCPALPHIILSEEKLHNFTNSNTKTIFDNVCFYGKVESCNERDVYSSSGIGLPEVCCPAPCLPSFHANDAIIVNGTCTFPV